MKKLWGLLALVLVFTGCAAAPTFETVGDDALAPVMGQSKQVLLDLPSDATVGAVNQDGSRIYWCEDYDIAVQTLPGGDLERTMKTLTGFSLGVLPVMQTQYGAVKRYEWVWSAVGEAGDRMHRAVLISEGEYHYCVTLSTAAENAGMLDDCWTQLLASVTIA